MASVSVRLLSLVATQSGHGPSYVRNYGETNARGRFLCFLDDDDQWIDPEHLGRVASVITDTAEPIDLILAKQQAFRNGAHVAGVHWVEDLDERVADVPDLTNGFSVTVRQLLN